MKNIFHIIRAYRQLLSKRGSDHAAHAAKALRWRLDQLLKCLIKEVTLFVMV